MPGNLHLFQLKIFLLGSLTIFEICYSLSLTSSLVQKGILNCHNIKYITRFNRCCFVVVSGQAYSALLSDWKSSRPPLCSILLIFKTSWQMLKVVFSCFKSYIDKYCFWLSNEPLYVIVTQGAAKLWRVKVGSLKRILPRSLLQCGQGSSPVFFWDFKLRQFSVLQPLKL